MDHMGFIIAAFGITLIIIGAMIGYILMDYRTLTRDLARLSAAESERSKSVNSQSESSKPESSKSDVSH